MGMLEELDEPTGSSFFSGAKEPPTLDDLLNRVGADFSLNFVRQREMADRIRGAMELPGNSVATPVYGIRGAIGAGLRAIADRYFTPKPLSATNIPGYRRIGS